MPERSGDLATEPWDLALVNFRLMSATAASPQFGPLAADSLAVARGSIAWIGTREDPAMRAYRGPIIDGEHRCLSPGLVDCHTHLVYAGNRADEWEARLAGRSYEEIARQGEARTGLSREAD